MSRFDIKVDRIYIFVYLWGQTWKLETISEPDSKRFAFAKIEIITNCKKYFEIARLCMVKSFIVMVSV
jgi:hypothetical protein